MNQPFFFRPHVSSFEHRSGRGPFVPLAAPVTGQVAPAPVIINPPVGTTTTIVERLPWWAWAFGGLVLAGSAFVLYQTYRAQKELRGTLQEKLPALLAARGGGGGGAAAALASRDRQRRAAARPRRQGR